MGKTTLRAYGNKRDTTEAAIVDALRKAGCRVYRLDKPVDLIVGYRGRIHLVEVKSKLGKLTKSQIDFMTEWGDAYLWIVRDVDGALDLLKQWGALGSAAEPARVGRAA